MNLTRALSIAALLSLSACAGMQQAYEDQVCNDAGGYERGMNDGRENKKMDTSFAQACESPKNRDAAIAGYGKGYKEGLAHAETTAAPVRRITYKNYYCEIKAFTKTYSAWGATELEAKVEAKNRCVKENNEMHCGDVACRKS